METKYHIIKSLQELDTLIQSCKYTGYCSYDFETNGAPLYNHDFKPTILSISFQPGFGCSIPLQHLETPKDFPWKKALLRVGHELMENYDIIKIGWNIKFDNQIWEKFGIYYRGTAIDGMLAKYILNEERPNDLKSMVRRYLPEYGNYEKQDAFDKIPWDQKELKPLCKYGCQDTDYTLRLTLFFEKKLIDLGLYNPFRNLMMCNSRVITSVEKCGLLVDREFNDQLVGEYAIKIKQAEEVLYNLPRVKRFTKEYNQQKVDAYISSIEKEIEDLNPNDPKDTRKIKSREEKIARIKAGEFTTKKEQELVRPLNFGSSKDLPAILFSKEGFHFKPFKTSETGKPSTDEESLTQLRLSVENPESPKAIFLDKLKEVRDLKHTYTTFILGWQEKLQDDSRLHGKFNIHGTDSNRFSSSDPNMQQIPKTSVDPNVKNQLIAPKGKLWLVFDYSQCELRMMAHLSGDETYLRAFKEGTDPHLTIAAHKYHVPIEEATKIYEDENHPDHKLWKVRRKQAKQIAFGLIYGIGVNLLAVKLSDPKAGIIVSKEEAQAEMDNFFSQHPKIKKFKEKQEKFLREHGYYRQLFGTKRRLPQIYSDDNAEVAYAIRLGLNFPCQGAAANMTNFGAILLYWKMRQGKLPMMQECCTVHDAIYMYANPDDINTWTVYSIWDVLRNPSTKKYFGFEINDVDLDMDFSIGRTMAEELPFIPGYNYNKMLQDDFSEEEYMAEYKNFKNKKIGFFSAAHPSTFPKLYKQEMKEYEQQFRKRKL